jgi:hypothetical protein
MASAHQKVARRVESGRKLQNRHHVMSYSLKNLHCLGSSSSIFEGKRAEIGIHSEVKCHPSEELHRIEILLGKTEYTPSQND